jgi:hypothetical protein
MSFGTASTKEAKDSKSVAPARLPLGTYFKSPRSLAYKTGDEKRLRLLATKYDVILVPDASDQQKPSLIADKYIIQAMLGPLVALTLKLHDLVLDTPDEIKKLNSHISGQISTAIRNELEKGSAALGEKKLEPPKLVPTTRRLPTDNKLQPSVKTSIPLELQQYRSIDELISLPKVKDDKEVNDRIANLHDLFEQDLVKDIRALNKNAKIFILGAWKAGSFLPKENYINDCKQFSELIASNKKMTLERDNIFFIYRLDQTDFVLQELLAEKAITLEALKTNIENNKQSDKEYKKLNTETAMARIISALVQELKFKEEELQKRAKELQFKEEKLQQHIKQLQIKKETPKLKQKDLQKCTQELQRETNCLKKNQTKKDANEKHLKNIDSLIKKLDYLLKELESGKVKSDAVPLILHACFEEYVFKDINEKYINDAKNDFKKYFLARIELLMERQKEVADLYFMGEAPAINMHLSVGPACYIPNPLCERGFAKMIELGKHPDICYPMEFPKEFATAQSMHPSKDIKEQSPKLSYKIATTGCSALPNLIPSPPSEQKKKSVRYTTYVINGGSPVFTNRPRVKIKTANTLQFAAVSSSASSVVSSRARKGGTPEPQQQRLSPLTATAPFPVRRLV